jgi:hypothetical protein
MQDTENTSNPPGKAVPTPTVANKIEKAPVVVGQTVVSGAEKVGSAVVTGAGSAGKAVVAGSATVVDGGKKDLDRVGTAAVGATRTAASDIGEAGEQLGHGVKHIVSSTPTKD